MGSLQREEDGLSLVASYSEYLQPPRRLTSSDWLESIKGFPKSTVLRRIRHPLWTATAVAFVVSVAHLVFRMPGLPTLCAHTLLGSGLSLLLVFRTNTAYQRFQEGRKIWNDILDLCRDIALNIALYRKEAGPKRVHVIRTSLQAFPFAMQKHVRAKDSRTMQERLEKLMAECQDEAAELSSSDREGERLRSMQPQKNRPLEIIWRLMRAVKTIRNQGDDFTNRERTWLLSMVSRLSHTVGRCERLVQTPVPLSYARHTSRFVSVWTLTLPFALVSSLGWLTPVVVFVITWALFGILEIGHMIEDPFRAYLELTPICEAIYHDCARALPPSRPPVAEKPKTADKSKADKLGEAAKAAKRGEVIHLRTSRPSKASANGKRAVMKEQPMGS